MGTRPVTVIACVAAGLVTQYLQSWTKVLEHLHSWAFSNSHRPKPSPYPTKNVGRVYPEFFPSFNFVQGGGEGKLPENFEKDALFYEGTQNDRKI